VADPPAVLGDRGFRWVQGVKTPPYRLRGGSLVETGWRGWVTRERILLGGSGTGSAPQGLSCLRRGSV